MTLKGDPSSRSGSPLTSSVCRFPVTRPCDDVLCSRNAELAGLVKPQRARRRVGPRASCGPCLGLLVPVALAVSWEIIVRIGSVERPPGAAALGDLFHLRRPRRHRRAAAPRHRDPAARASPALPAASCWARLPAPSPAIPRSASRLLDPSLQGLRAILSIAWVPLFILWFGIFEASKIILIAIGVFFPVYLGRHGRRALGRPQDRRGRSRLSPVGLGHGVAHSPAGDRARLCHLAAGPGLGLGWMFVVAAEFMGASEGLGFLLIDGQQLGKPAQIVAAIVAFALLGKLTDWIVASIAAPVPALGRRLRVAGEDKPHARVRPRRQNLSQWRARARRVSRLEVAPGEILVIIGGSGCGKSTLLRARQRPRCCQPRAASPSTGRLSTAPHEKIGLIFQEPRLLPWLSVANNVGFGLSHVARPERAKRDRGRLAGALG